MEFHFYEPSAGHGLRHNPLNSIIAPRPIGWISTRSKEGGFNLAPYSFFNTFHYDPPILGFASTGWKDTAQNAVETGEFVWNLVSEDLGEQMNMTSQPVARGVDEFKLAGLTAIAANKVSAPRVAESRASMECKVVDVVQFRNTRGEQLPGWLVLGEVVGVHIDHDLLKDGVYQTALARPLMRCGGLSDYALLSQEWMVEIHRAPDEALRDSHGS
ncbi:flavin reductase family protein [Variovorax paradoxus]|jgi:flavin reductase (DIM6/NTAB) family NADH-FMN oxidoreductase RutF|uniref:flavin reductase family protein n=1 Tax=Variovorax paradoxus TaxID=34073 RepID=UPI00037731BA|nr:flavin reductase family protein [Variovorax paradoxus]